MSIKDLFNSSGKSVIYSDYKTQKEAFEPIESVRNAEQIEIKDKAFVPSVDYSNPVEFARYGSAELYYKGALEKIIGYYPYDGSKAEQNKFYNGLLEIEKYVFDDLYPTSLGYVTISENAYDSSGTTLTGYGQFTAPNEEYITFYGGPGTGSLAEGSTLSQQSPNPYSSAFNYSNIYDENIYTTEGLPYDYGKGTRLSNLRANFDDGVTIETWLTTGSLHPKADASKQVLLDWWNNNILASSDYGRLRVELTSSKNAAGFGIRPFVITVNSGSQSSMNKAANSFFLGKVTLHDDLGSLWKHYAITLYNTSSAYNQEGTTIRADLYVDGILNDTYPRDGGMSLVREIPGIQAWYRLSEDYDSLSSVTDHSGKGHNGSFGTYSKPSKSQTTPGTYLQSASNLFDNSGTDGINIGTPATWDALIGADTGGGSTEKLTFAAWVRRTGAGAGGKGKILDFGLADFGFYIDSTNHLCLEAKWDSGTPSLFTYRSDDAVCPTTASGEWVHVAVTYDLSSAANDPILYVNGKSVPGSWDGAVAGTFDGIIGADCFIGNNSSKTRHFNGYIAEVIICNSVLLPRKIYALYADRGHTVGELPSQKAMGRIGALLTSPGWGDTAAVSGDGKLSGSLDEFRFWKVKRTQKQIAENFFTQVGGGANTDIANADLGVYYKFNEGKTGNATTDQVVLDYAGRVCNGVWTNYTANSRFTGSAILLAKAALRETPDPIVRANNPRYAALQTSLLEKGRVHDLNNNSMFINYSPSWVIDLHDTLQGASQYDNTNLEMISHLMGAYFDKLYNLIHEVPKLKHYNYPSASATPLPFSMHLPQSMGLYAPDLFVDASVLEHFENRTETEQFAGRVVDIKNLIYQNLYNNIANIYKSKGTETAIRNVLRCFNIDDSLVRFKTYSRNNVYDLKNNLRQIARTNARLNYNNLAQSHGVVYQANNSLSYPSTGYIHGTRDGAGFGTWAREEVCGATIEADIVFPKFDQNEHVFPRYFHTSSLFGMYTVNTASAGSLSGHNTAYVSQDDWTNFQVYAIRDSLGSKNVRFMLTSDRSPYPIPEITSSTFLDVYDDNRWNLSVRVKSKNYPLGGIVSGSGPPSFDGQPFEVIFRGVNTVLGTVVDQFELTSALSYTTASYFLGSTKRLYCGAKRFNITSSIQHPADTYISDLKYWAHYIDNSDLDQHLYDLENAGISQTYQPLLAQTNSEILRRSTLGLHWSFEDVTSSNSLGQFRVIDYSSGSRQMITASGWLGEVTQYRHPGLGYGFVTSSGAAISRTLENSFKFTDPEETISSNMISILSEDDKLFKIVETVPNYVFTIEKSMYQAISEEMMIFLAGVTDFHNLIGNPLNRYRDRYKNIEKLRELFFQRVTEISDVEKYIKYYKWFDDALGIILSQLVPASADLVPDVLNIVESHTLERNKYETQFPTIENFSPVVGSSIKGFGDRSYPGFLGQTTQPTSPRDTTRHIPFWKKRALRDAPEITSGDATIDSQRETYRIVINSHPRLSQSIPFVVDMATNQKYFYRPFFQRGRKLTGFKFDSPVTKAPSNAKVLKGGTNFSPSKDIDFTYTALRPAGPVYTSGGVYVPQNVLLSLEEDFAQIPVNNDPPSDPSEKEYRVVKVQHGRDYQLGLGYSNVKSTLAYPFNMVSSSLTTGYQKDVTNQVKGINIVNLHNDVYGPHMEKPIQGPFTEHNVGGHQSRHVPLNRGDDSWRTRPEAWMLMLGRCSGNLGAIGMVGPDYPWPDENSLERPDPYPAILSQKAWLYRDFTAKSPVNIKNIHRSGAIGPVLGNYRQPYDIVTTFGKHSNPSHLVKNENWVVYPPDTFPSYATGTTVVNTLLDIRSREHGKLFIPAGGPGPGDRHPRFNGEYATYYLQGRANRSVISNRFGAPGGMDTTQPGLKDFRSGEFSAYNALPFRNLMVIRPNQGPSGTIGATEGMRISDLHGKDFGMRALLARHCGKFGRDSLWVQNPGATYNQLPSFQKTNRNRLTMVDREVVYHHATVTASCLSQPPADTKGLVVGVLPHIVVPGNQFEVKVPYGWEAPTAPPRIYTFNYQTILGNPGSSDLINVQIGGTNDITIANTIDAINGLAISTQARYYDNNPIHRPLRITAAASPAMGAKGIDLFATMMGDLGNLLVYYSSTSSLTHPTKTGINQNFSGGVTVYNSVPGVQYKYDNAFVQHAIPRSTSQYLWISASAVNLNAAHTPAYTPFNFLVSSGTTLINAYDFVSASDFGAFSSSTGFYYGRDKKDSWLVGKDFLPVDFVGSNTIINENVDMSTNTVGNANSYYDYLNTNIIDKGFAPSSPTPSAVILNSLLLNRGGAYGWSGRQPLYQNNNIVLRNERQSNMLSLKNSDNSLTKYNNPPITMDGRPVYVNLDFMLTSTLPSTNVTLEMPLGVYQYFNTNDLNNRFSFDQYSYITQFEQLMQLARDYNYKLNWVLYSECIFPADRNEFLSYSRGRIGYTNDFWRNNRQQRNTLGSTLPTTFDYTGYSQSAWVLDAPIDFLTRTGPQILSHWWTGSNRSDLLKISGAAGELQNIYSTYTYVPSAYDFNSKFETFGGAVPWPGVLVVGQPVSSGGAYKVDWKSKALTPGPLYARKSTLSSQLSVVSPHGISNPPVYRINSIFSAWATGSNHGGGPTTHQFRVLDPLKAQNTGSLRRSDAGYMSQKNQRLAGEAKWEANTLAGIVVQSGTTSQFVSHPSEPWFDEYGDFKYELQKMAKDYAIVPEFRISEHIKSYKQNGLLNEGKTNTFEIVGTSFDSSQDMFYRDYSNSDFLKEFANVKANSLLNASEIRLVCDAAIRFNPYKGFYPAQRSAQLVDQLKDSYNRCYEARAYYIGTDGVVPFESSVGLSGLGSTTARTMVTGAQATNLFEGQFPGATRHLNKTLFAPGILYNSIKAGVAVDYPIVSDARKIARAYPFPSFLQAGDGYASNGFPAGANPRHNTDISMSYENAMAYCQPPMAYDAVDGTASLLNTPEWNPWYDEGDEVGIYKDFFDIRLPFETIIKPENHLQNVTVCDLETDYALRDGGTYGLMLNTFRGQPADNIYTSMARNFFGAIPSFFLKDSSFTTLRSKTFAGTRQFASGAVYMARVKMLSSYSGSRNYTNEYMASVGGTSQNSASVWLEAGPRAVTASIDPSGTITQLQYLSGNVWFPIPQHPRNKIYDPSRGIDLTFPDGRNLSFQESFTMYSRTDAFGPPLAGTYAGPGAEMRRLLPTVQRWLSASYAYAGWGYFQPYYTSGPQIGTASYNNVGNTAPAAPRYLEYTMAPWDREANREYPNMTPLPVFDSLTGYNWAYTPPYYDGEAWADLIFRPDPTKHYDLQTILDEVDVYQWRVDPGYVNPNPRVNIFNSTEFVINITGTIFSSSKGIGGAYPQPFSYGNKVFDYPSSPYAGKMINKSAMQLNASVDLFGVENVGFVQESTTGEKSTRNQSIGQRWVIQPKFETPHANFSDIGTRPLRKSFMGVTGTVPGNITLPLYASSAVPQGMWHQFGIIDPDPQKGIFLEIGAIPSNWLKYHYNVTLESSPYNNYNVHDGPNVHKNVQSLAHLAGFDKSRARLGELKESMIVKEAVVAVPYITTIPVPLGSKTKKYFEGKRFITIPRERIDAAQSSLRGTPLGQSLDAAGISIRDQLAKMENYIFPPQFNFIENSNLDPMAMYIFEFTYEFDKDDLNYIWQNLAPRNYQRVHMQSDSVSHALLNSELLSEHNLADNENLRWMIFKVKQRGQDDYYDHVKPQGSIASDDVFEDDTLTPEEKYLQYNWPYDYLSFVELIKMDVQVKFDSPTLALTGSELVEIDIPITAEFQDPNSVSSLSSLEQQVPVNIANNAPSNMNKGEGEY
tara:strand:+ start:63663 stop:75155 length:11493 start_codon:yes stop_codon:yes gene_type:complete